MKAFVAFALAVGTAAASAAPDCGWLAVEREARQVSRQARRVERLAARAFGYQRVREEARALRVSAERLADGAQSSEACPQLQSELVDDLAPSYDGLRRAEAEAQRRRPVPKVRQAVEQSERSFGELRQILLGPGALFTDYAAAGKFQFTCSPR